MKNRMQAITLSALISIPAIVIAAPVQTAQGVGVIKAIDAKSQSVTLAHDAIPALKWAGMTMPFKLAKPDLAKGLTVGQKVAFALEVEGGNYRITAIRPAK